MREVKKWINHLPDSEHLQKVWRICYHHYDKSLFLNILKINNSLLKTKKV